MSDLQPDDWMTMDYPIDETTRLPALPESYFWRVKQGLLGIFPWVELRKKTLIGSRRVDALWQGHTKFASSEEEILYLTEQILERQQQWANRAHDAALLSGDYPPMRLERP